MICAVVMTDGRRDCIAESIPTLRKLGPFSRRVIHDDSGDPEYRAWLMAEFPDFELIVTPSRSGFGGAYASMFRHMAAAVEPFLFVTEDDFVFHRYVDLTTVADTLTRHPHLVQLALRRQAWSDAEIAAGGVVEQHPDDYTECSDAGAQWLEHTRFFTTNPSMYRRTLCERGWPTGQNSEGRFGIALREEHPDARFAFWGSRQSGEWVHHIGHERVGTGY